MRAQTEMFRPEEMQPKPKVNIADWPPPRRRYLNQVIGKFRPPIPAPEHPPQELLKPR